MLIEEYLDIEAVLNICIGAFLILVQLNYESGCIAHELPLLF
jgi:hypothetical protein